MAWKIAVRCCCDPRLVLGVVELYEMPVRGRWYSFALKERLSLEFGAVPEIMKSLSLQVDNVLSASTGREELALRSDETPIDELRKIRSWREVDRVIEIGDY